MKVTFSSLGQFKAEIQKVSPSPTQEQIQALKMTLNEMPQVDLSTIHHLMNGMYARSIFIPKGCALVGARHKTDHINIVHGDISVSTDEGQKRITGFRVIPTKAGMQRCGLALEDTHWVTLTRTDFESLDSLAEIEEATVFDAKELQTRKMLN